MSRLRYALVIVASVIIGIIGSRRRTAFIAKIIEMLQRVIEDGSAWRDIVTRSNIRCLRASHQHCQTLIRYYERGHRLRILRQNG